jgi:hypothetical protein
VLAVRHRDRAHRSAAARNGVPFLELLTARETTMRKLIVLAATAFVLAAGTATVLTVQPQPAMACPSGTC